SGYAISVLQESVPAEAAMDAAGSISRREVYGDKSQSFALPSAPVAKAKQNLQYDEKARIQTGPGLPEWTWRQVSYAWDGPVSSGQTIRPNSLPPWLVRGIEVLRVVLLLALAGVLLRLRPRGAILPGLRS